MSIIQIFFPIHCVLCPSDRHCFVYTGFCVHQTDIFSYTLGSVSIGQTLFPMHWVLCASDTLFRMRWSLCPSERYCFLRAWPDMIRWQTKNGTWHYYRTVSSIGLWQKKQQNWPALYSSGVRTSGPWNDVIALFSNSCLNNSWAVTMEAEDTLSGFPITHSHFCLNFHVSAPFPCFPWKVCLCVLPLKQNGFCVRYLLYGIT